MRHLLMAAAAACALMAATVHADTLGIFAQHSDVGANALPGSASFDSGAYRLTASGANIWGTIDAFHYAANRVSGDTYIASDIALIGTGVDPHRKAGVMLRQSLDADSAYVDIMVHGDGLVSLQYRATRGAETHQIVANQKGATRVALEYHDGYAWMALADDKGEVRHVGGGVRIALTGPYYAGLAVTAHNNTVSETATFANVALEEMAPGVEGWPTPTTRAESTIEIMSISDRNRTIVHHSKDLIEAPNWSPDGTTLLFNSGGHLYTLPATGGTPVQLDSGPLKKINNDHGYSPDGQWIVVSDQTEADNQSRIHILPAKGGTPRLITPRAPSYWHGWSPDGKTLAYIANRGGDYDVYTVPVTGGAETQVTASKGLDDGAEYTPDGQWIWFNSVRSGNMKLWRMRADGSAPEQMTRDAHTRDWFPHPSPDGKWIAYISFGTDVDAGDHPANKNVTLMLMPADGGDPVALTTLLGGQGTINVPSWSPDSKRIAFVSYRPVGD